MAFVPTHTFSDGDILPASQLNGIYTDLGNQIVDISSIQTITGNKTFTGTTSFTTATGITGVIEILMDGAGSPLQADTPPAVHGYLSIPFGCTITAVTTIGDVSGSIVVDLWKCTYSAFDAGSTHPVAGDKITASAPPTISTATKAIDTTLTGWITTVTAGDIIGFTITSCTNITKCTVALKYTRT